MTVLKPPSGLLDFDQNEKLRIRMRIRRSDIIFIVCLFVFHLIICYKKENGYIARFRLSFKYIDSNRHINKERNIDT